jgi:hypothetical protein
MNSAIVDAAFRAADGINYLLVPVPQNRREIRRKGCRFKFKPFQRFGTNHDRHTSRNLFYSAPSFNGGSKTLFAPIAEYIMFVTLDFPVEDLQVPGIYFLSSGNDIPASSIVLLTSSPPYS